MSITYLSEVTVYQRRKVSGKTLAAKKKEMEGASRLAAMLCYGLRRDGENGGAARRRNA